jgi:hypothetical protein
LPVNVKLSLEVIWRCGHIASLIHTLVTGQKCVNTFTLRPLHLGERNIGTQIVGVWVGPRVGLNAFEKRKHFSLPGVEHYSAVRILTELSWLDLNLKSPESELRVTATGPPLKCANTKCYAVDSYALKILLVYKFLCSFIMTLSILKCKALRYVLLS